MTRRVVIAVLTGVAALACVSAATAAPQPSVRIVRATVDRAAHTVDLRLRICFSAGPRAQIEITERRQSRGGAATRRWVPRGEEPAGVSPFACRSGWRLNWLVEPRLRGPGTYGATIRVRDAYGRWSTAVAFSVSSA